jgi:hypothetical protein
MEYRADGDNLGYYNPLSQMTTKISGDVHSVVVNPLNKMNLGAHLFLIYNKVTYSTIHFKRKCCIGVLSRISTNHKCESI